MVGRLEVAHEQLARLSSPCDSTLVQVCFNGAPDCAWGIQQAEGVRLVHCLDSIEVDAKVELEAAAHHKDSHPRMIAQKKTHVQLYIAPFQLRTDSVRPSGQSLALVGLLVADDHTGPQ
jgi:hypothetical protein